MPLWHAAAYGEYAMAETLLDAGADVNAMVYASGCPMERAYGARDERMKALLLRRGAVVPVETIGLYRNVQAARDVIEGRVPAVTDRRHVTAYEQLLWAGACGGEPEIVELCLPRIDRAPSDPWWSPVLRQPMRIWNHGPLDGSGFDRYTYPRCLEVILEHGVDPDVTDHQGFTALQHVAQAGTTWGRQVITEEERVAFATLLLAAGAGLTRRDPLLRSTPLGWACRWGRSELAKLLIERGAAVDETDAEAWATPLAWAAGKGHDSSPRYCAGTAHAAEPGAAGRAGIRPANRMGGATLASVTVAPTNDRFLRGGQPFFYLGDTAWMAFSNVSPAMWTEYVRYRREQGFTALQISVLPINHDTSVAATNDSPFARRDGGWDYGARNDAYFDKAERMVAEAVEAGLVPVLGVLWRNYVPGTRSSTANPVAGPMPFDVMEQYVAHIARRFRPYEPMFFISGDTFWESRDEPRYYLRALELIRAGCPDALVSMHLTPQADLPDQVVDAVDFYMFQSGHSVDHPDRPWRLAEKFASSRIRRPVINSEPCYEGHGRGVGRARQVRGQWTRSEVRAAAWQSLLSGAKAGVTYGGHGVWSFHTREKRFLNDYKYVPMDWWEALRLPGAWDYGYARWLFETFGLADLAPNQALVANADTAIRAAAGDGAGVVAVYMPHAVSLEVDADLSRHRITLLDLERRRPYTTDVAVSGGRTRFQLPNAGSDLLLIAVR